jgi:hypothetical protein
LRPLRTLKKSGKLCGVNQNTTQQHQGAPIGTATHPSTATPTSQKWESPKAPIADRAQRAPAKQPLPEWIDARRANHIFTLCKSSLYRIAAEGKIRTASLKDRGKLRGKRLFSTDSIVSYLESRASGGDAS